MYISIFNQKNQIASKTKIKFHTELNSFLNFKSTFFRKAKIKSWEETKQVRENKRKVEMRL